jgi:uncharacterized cupin superfamily protein
MKTIHFAGTAALLFALGNLSAAPLKTAVLTAAVKDVKVSEKSAAARPASVGQKLGASSTLLTGRGSRAALTFQDKTVTRIGANSVFRFNSGTRDLAVEKGSFLLQVPKNAGGATIRTATVTAAITGTTVMMEYNPGKWIKFVCLEGNAILTNQNGDKLTVSAGQMLVMNPDAKSFPELILINIKKMIETSNLMDDGVFGDLDQTAMDEIAETIAGQLQRRRMGDLIPQGSMRDGPTPHEESPNGAGARTVLPVPPTNPEFPGMGFPMTGN